MASEESPSPRRPGWRAGDVARATVVVLVVYGIAQFLYFAHELLFIAFLGVLLGLAVAAGARRLERLGIPRGIGAPLIVFGVVGILVGLGAWSGPTVRVQYRELRQRLPIAFVRADRWLAQQRGGLIGALIGAPDTAAQAAPQGGPRGPAQAPSTGQPGAITAPRPNKDTVVVENASADSLAHLKAIRDQLIDRVTGDRSYLLPVIHSTLAAAAGVVLILFLAVYVGIGAEMYRRGILSLVPRHRRDRWEELLASCASGLRRWLVMELIAMLVIGSVTTIVLLVIGVRSAIPLGILAGLLEFVPNVGPVLSAIPAVAMAFIDSPEKALIVAIAYIGIQFLENHLLIPVLMKEGVDLPPVVTILTQAGMALVFGIVGLFIAVPLLVLVTITVKLLYVEDTLGGEGTELPYTEHHAHPSGTDGRAG